MLSLSALKSSLKSEQFPLECYLIEYYNFNVCQGKENNFKLQQSYR